jgi:hypothetical protein
MKKNYYTIMMLLFSAMAAKIQAQVTLSATAGTLTANYASLKSAFDNINNGTHQGIIDIRIHSNTSESDSCRLDSSGFGGLSNYTSILIRPADTATVPKVISTSISGMTLIYLQGADNIIFDGRPLGTGSSRLLTFEHTNPNTIATSCAVRMINGVTNSTFQFINSTLLTTTATTSSNNFNLSTSAFGIGNTNITVSRCSLLGGVIGINIAGTLTNTMDSIFIRNNSVTNAQGSSIVVNAVRILVIDSNTISHTSSFTGWNVFGLNINPNINGAVYNITNNNIHSLQTGSAAQMAGILISPGTTGLTTIPIVNLNNNSVSLLSTNAGLTFARAFQFQGTNPAIVNCRYNTFRLGGSGAGTAGNPASIAVAKSNSATGSSFVFINNICINTRTGAANPHVGFWNSQPTAGVNTSDFNLFFGPVFSAIASGIYQGTITAFKTASAPNDQNSMFGNLDFTNIISPTLNPAGLNNTAVKLLGTPTTVTTDMYGTVRDVSRPYKGAFEGSQSVFVNNDLQPIIIYTFGRIPTGTIDTVRVVIRNNGLANAVNVPIQLTSSLAGPIGSVNVNLGSGLEATFNMVPYTPIALGFDTLRVFPSVSDQNPANDSVLWVRENTLNALSYTRPFVNQFGNVGTNPEGEIVAKFSTPVPNFINQVNVNFTNVAFTGPWPFQVIIYPDSGGNNGPSRTPLYVSSTQNTLNGIFNLALPSIPVSGSFYVGVRQTSPNNFGFAYQNENPIRDRTFYFRQGASYATLAWNDFAVNPNNQFRFMIEPRLKINDDLGVTDVVLPGTGCNSATTSGTVSVKVQNLGLLTQNFGTNSITVNGTIVNPNNVTTSLGPVTINSGTLNSDSSINVVLSTSYNMSLNGNYTIRAWVTSTIDNNKVNDTLPATVRIVTPSVGTPYTQNFNAGLTIPTEITSNRFAVTAGVGYQNSNALRVNLLNTSPFTANAFVITPRLTGINANSMLRFEYRITNLATGDPTILGNIDTMRVFVSTDCGQTYTQERLIVGTLHIPSVNYQTISVPLGSYALTDIRVKIQFDWFGTTNDANVDIDNIRVITLTNDMAAIGTISPCLSLIAGSAPINPIAQFTNFGGSTITTASVKYQINGPINYLDSSVITSLASNATATVSFLNTFNPSVAGNYNAKIYSSITTDSDPINDTFYYSFVVINNSSTNAGNALTFSGNEFGRVANKSSINFSGNAMSIEAWVNRGTAVAGNRIILSKDSSLTSGQYALLISGSNALTFSLTTTNGPNAANSTIPIPANTFTHVAATYDGALIRLYLNGTLVGSTPHTGNIVARNSALNIGQNFASTNRFIGQMDEVKLWNIALTEDSIRRRMHTRLPNANNANLVAYYRFDEGSGNLVNDASGNCNTIELTTPVWQASTYPLTNSPIVSVQHIIFGGSYNFTGTDLSLSLNSYSGSDSIYVHRFNGSPSGTNPIASPGGVTAVHPRSWIIYKYGSGTFANADISLSLGTGNLNASVVDSQLVLFSRENGVNTGWLVQSASATSTNFSTQTVMFNQSSQSFLARQLAVGANNNPVPVKLMYFTGKAQENDVVLRWATASETNNAGFFVERSADGVHFERIDFVKGATQSDRIQTYAYTDLNAFANADKWMYRLAQQDFNGDTEHSKTITLYVSSDDDGIGSVNVYPNPFSKNLFVEVDANESSHINISITNIQGKVISNKYTPVHKGIQNINIGDLDFITEGLYFVKVLTQNGSATTYKILKQ